MIITANSDTIQAMIENVAINTITYRYEGEHTSYTISKNMVKEIVYSDGRVEKISTPVIVRGEEDWRKVKITSNPQDVEGLKEKGNVSLLLYRYWEVYVDIDKLDEKIKKIAASQKAHWVLIQMMTGTTNNQVYFRGVSYGY